MSKNTVITSGFGALTPRALADADHTVYPGMRDVTGTHAHAAQLDEYPSSRLASLRYPTPVPTRAGSFARSSASSACPRANGHSACTSTLGTTQKRRL